MHRIRTFFLPSFAVSNDDGVTDGSNAQNISYDVSKLVDFPGFNVAVPYQMKDVSPVTPPTKCFTRLIS